MGRLKTLLAAMLCLAAIHSHAAYRVVLDKKTVSQVVTNQGYVTAAEMPHNVALDSISKKKQRIAQMVTGMETFKELYKQSMTNINGFGVESKMYVNIANRTVDIIRILPEALRAVNNSPIKNPLVCNVEIVGLATKVSSLVETFSNVVNNGKVELRLPKDTLSFAFSPKGGDGDGYNFLNRYERYALANRILTELSSIYYKLEAIIFKSRYLNTLSNAILALDAQTWCNYFQGKTIVTNIIRSWKGIAS